MKDIDWKILGTYSGILQLPSSKCREIEGDFTADDERKSAAISFYLSNYPFASWRHLITRLDVFGEHSAAARIQPFAEKLTGM